MTSAIFCTLAILYFSGHPIATVAAFPSSGESKAHNRIGDRNVGSPSTHDTNQLIVDLEEIAENKGIPLEQELLDTAIKTNNDDLRQDNYPSTHSDMVKGTNPNSLLGYDFLPKYDEPEYDYDVIDYDSKEGGETTDELLQRLLKEHEARLTLKLMREESSDDTFEVVDEDDSTGHNPIGTLVDVGTAIAKRTKEDQTHQGLLKDKKDIESWLHQADPSLTVRELPEQPQISFRKNSPFSATENGAEIDKNENPNDILSPRRRGMKEEVMDRPALNNNPRFVPSSPFSKFPTEG